MKSIIASPDELIFFNDAQIRMENLNARKGLALFKGRKKLTNETYPDTRRGPNDLSNKVTTRIATDLTFNLTTWKWENDDKEYDHEDLKFITSKVPEGNDCQLNLDDIVVFMRDWLNKEKLSMELLSSDESLGCIIRGSERGPFDGTGRPGMIVLARSSDNKRI